MRALRSNVFGRLPVRHSTISSGRRLRRMSPLSSSRATSMTVTGATIKLDFSSHGRWAGLREAALSSSYSTATTMRRARSRVA